MLTVDLIIDFVNTNFEKVEDLISFLENHSVKTGLVHLLDNNQYKYLPNFQYVDANFQPYDSPSLDKLARDAFKIRNSFSCDDYDLESLKFNWREALLFAAKEGKEGTQWMHLGEIMYKAELGVIPNDQHGYSIVPVAFPILSIDDLLDCAYLCAFTLPSNLKGGDIRLLRECEYCKKLFIRNRDSNRAQARAFCSNRCRWAFNNTKKAKERAAYMREQRSQGRFQ